MMENRLPFVFVIIYFTLFLQIGHPAHAQEEWWESWAVLKELGYEYSGLPFTRNGDDIYFIGKKRLSSKYPSMRDTFLHLKFSEKTVEECVPAEEIAKYFPERIQTDSECFTINSQGTLLAVGSVHLYLSKGETETAIFLIDLKKKAIRSLLDNQDDNRNYKFSPDGRHLLFGKHYGTDGLLAAANKPTHSYGIGVINLLDGKVTTLKPIPEKLTELFGYHFPSAWSPDSQTLVFQYRDPSASSDSLRQLFASDMQTLECRLLMKNRFSCDDILFIDADRFVANISGKIDLVDTKTNTTQNLLSAEGQHVRKLRRVGNSIEYRIGKHNVSIKSVSIPTK